jgi:LAS superfamily LD-carboxypeptidase LdcB
MRFNLGISTIVPTNLDNGTSGLSYFPARVEKIILSNEDPDWEENGGWDALGMIHFTPYYPGTLSVPNNGAKPYFSNIKHYPLQNEIVMVIQLPDPTIQDPYYTSFYYMDVINMWNHPHHNAFPKIDLNDTNNNLKLDYQDISSGLAKKETDQSPSIKLGKTFSEKSNIHSLLPFEGDIIYEGRWGQSIRFGSTVRNNPNNIWSTAGNNGDPILIIKNGQSIKLDEKGWIPATENINDDESSIYFCSNQLIPINVASSNLQSFNTTLAKKTISTQTLQSSPTSSTPSPTPTSSIAATQSVALEATSSVTSSFTEEQIEYIFPGEAEEFKFEFDGEDDPAVETSKVKYNPDILSNESSQTKSDKLYYTYENGNIANSSNIVYIEGIRVAKSYETKIKLLIDAAKKDGIPIKINDSFRTYDEQIALRKKNIINKSKIEDLDYILNAEPNEFSPETGKPGYSNHQNGKAFDFNTANSIVYEWLAREAVKYGFVRTVKSEKWHWEYRENTDQYAFVPKEHESWPVISTPPATNPPIPTPNYTYRAIRELNDIIVIVSDNGQEIFRRNYSGVNFTNESAVNAIKFEGDNFGFVVNGTEYPPQNA